MLPSAPSSACAMPPWLSSRPIVALFCLSSPSSLTTWDSCFSLALATSLPPFPVSPTVRKVPWMYWGQSPVLIVATGLSPFPSLPQALARYHMIVVGVNPLSLLRINALLQGQFNDWHADDVIEDAIDRGHGWFVLVYKPRPPEPPCRYTWTREMDTEATLTFPPCRSLRGLSRSQACLP